MEKVQSAVEDFLSHTVAQIRATGDDRSYRPVALTSHIVKTLERLLVRRMRLQVAEGLDPLQMCFCPCCTGAWFICESHVLWLLQCLQHHTASHTERQASKYGSGPLPDIVDYQKELFSPEHHQDQGAGGGLQL